MKKNNYGSIKEGTSVTVRLDSGTAHGVVTSNQADQIFIKTDAGNILVAHKSRVTVDAYDDDDRRFKEIMSAWRKIR